VDEASPRTKGARRRTNPDCECGGRWVVGRMVVRKIYKAAAFDRSATPPGSRHGCFALDAGWVIPFPDVEPFRRTYKGNMNTLLRSAVLRPGSRCENAWNLIGAR
jgi:hypothetical protein